MIKCRMCGRKIETRKTEYDENSNVCIRTRYCKYCKKYIKTYEYCYERSYIKGWHDALAKAIDESFNIDCGSGHFKVVQYETLLGLGMCKESEES